MPAGVHPVMTRCADLMVHLGTDWKLDT